jgi:copper resistance protein B
MRSFPRFALGVVAGLSLGVGTEAPTAGAQALHTPTANSSTVPSAFSLPPTPFREKLDEAKRILLNQSLQNEDGGYDHPTHSDQNYAFFRAEVLEYRPRSDDSDFRWDMQGWYGGDFNRLWVKSEGERNTAFKADYDIDMQLLYGRLIKKYYDFQVGVRGETQTFKGENVARAHAVIGFQGLVPYRYELESALFISQEGDVSARFQTSRDFLLTQRLILQGRFETHAAVQKVEKFTTGRGLNNIELGLRLRYEIRREIAPYVGVSYDHSFFRTADLVQEEGGDPSQVRFIAGLRLWF